jgi:hypothetical protein
MLDEERAQARAIVFSNSRTLPGQLWVCSVAMASGEIRMRAMPFFFVMRWRK